MFFKNNIRKTPLLKDLFDKDEVHAIKPLQLDTNNYSRNPSKSSPPVPRSRMLMKYSDKLVSEPVPDDLGLTGDQLVIEERVGKSAPCASVEYPQALVTNLSYTESSTSVLSPVHGPYVLCPVPSPSLDPLIRDERVDKSPTYKVTKDSEKDSKNNLSYPASVLSPIPGPAVISPVPGSSLNPLVREERVDKSHSYKISNNSEGD